MAGARVFRYTHAMPHIHEKIDFTAEVFIVFQNKVLLRKHDKYKAWLSVGGHVELDEDPVQTVIREAKEEVGLDVTLVGEPLKVVNEGQGGYHELPTPRFLYRHYVNDKHVHVVFVYFGTSESDQVINQEGEHSEAIRWFSREELNDLQFGIEDATRQHATEALEACR